jgi:hypothetical protein
VQEGRAREDEILFRLTSITTAASSANRSAVGQQTGPVVSSPAVLPKASKAPNLDLSLPTDDSSYTGTRHHSDKLQGNHSLKDAASDDFAEEARSKKVMKDSAKSTGSVRLSKRRLDSAETRQIFKGKTGNQSDGSEINSGWQSTCDVVIFPGPAAQVQHNYLTATVLCWYASEK